MGSGFRQKNERCDGGRTALGNLRRGGKLSGYEDEPGEARPWGTCTTALSGVGSGVIRPSMKRGLRRPLPPLRWPRCPAASTRDTVRAVHGRP